MFFVSLTVLTVIPADGAVARTRLQWLKDQQPLEKTVSVPPTKAEENTAPIGRPAFWLESLEAFNYEPVIRETVIDVQLLPRESPRLETTTEALQGLQTELDRETIWQYPTVNLQEIQLAIPDIRAAAEELRGTESEAFTVDDYIPEPDVTPLFTVNSDVATITDDQAEWRATLWGGLMTDNDLESTLIGQGVRFEDSNFVGLGVSRTLAGGNTIKVEGELQLLHHVGKQDHIEGTAALALRWLMSPSFSIALVEGVSYATALPEIEDENFPWASSHFLNYLAFEVEYVYTQDWAIAGRLHHRSGVAGLYGNTSGASNAYLFGVRHRF